MGDEQKAKEIIVNYSEEIVKLLGNISGSIEKLIESNEKQVETRNDFYKLCKNSIYAVTKVLILSLIFIFIFSFIPLKNTSYPLISFTLISIVSLIIIYFILKLQKEDF